MLNINQNFDLKAPVFNFDRDYFNSVEELNAYDTSNVPDHFVTNVAGMLYLFTDGKWLPMINTEYGSDTNHYVNLGCANAYININDNSYPNSLTLYGEDDSEVTMTTDSLNIDSGNKHVSITADSFSLKSDLGDFIFDASNGLSIDYSTGYDIYTDMGDGSINLISTSEGFNYSSRIYPGEISIHNRDDDQLFVISCLDSTEGAVISGIKSLTAFANPSATKVWATDGSIADLATKANASDVLLKKSANGGYYIESNSNELGWGAFAANMLCTASGSSSFAEGCGTKALGYSSHAEGYYTTANGTSTHAEGERTQATQSYAHAEGNYTVSNGYCSHAEGSYTEASGFCAHALGAYNIANKNAIHSVGIGNSTTRKNAEYIYAKNTEYSNGLVDDPKNGYKYLIGVGGYDGISIDNTTYKSVQEVIADLTARIEQLETKVRALEAANTPA